MDRKRVRFTYDEPDPDDEAADGKSRKLRFPKGRKGLLDEEQETDESILAKDARVAATERAVRRSTMDTQLRSAEDTANIHDVTEAEEGFETVEDDGIKMEPFNLDAERKDGYFDADGHFVEYETKYEARDAWLDNVEVDTRFADQHLNQTADTEETEKEISKKELAEIKRRIADTLQPGETVLEALRRLKGTKKVKLTGEAKQVFDSLTEDAMRLMDNGEYDVYHEQQESFRREAEGYEALERVKNGNGVVDIFGDENEDVTGDVEGSTGDDQSSGFAYDETSGYFYNSEVGYYYDPRSGLYSSSPTGEWYKFDVASNSYVEG